MPVNTSETGSLEINDPNLPPSVQTKLNDRLRRIGRFIGTVSSGSGPGPGPGGGGGSASFGTQLVFTVPGTLAIESGAAPLLMLPSSVQFSQAVLLLNQAPQGGAVTVQLYVNGAAWGTALSISATSQTVSLSAGAIAANQSIRLDITNVGLAFPGMDLTLLLR